MLFYKKRYLIAVYDYTGEVLEDVIISKKDREKFFKKIDSQIDSSEFFCNMIKRYKNDFPYIKAERIKKIFYFIDVFENHNDIFNDCDKKFLQECFMEDIHEKGQRHKICKQDLMRIAKNYKIEKMPLNGANLNEIKSVDKILDTISKSR